MKDTKARSLVSIMLVVAISALALRIAIASIIKINISQNESNAQSTLRTISVAIENYATANAGAYPDAESKLLPASLGGRADPPYLNKAYNGLTENGYKYDYIWGGTSYTITARPVNCTTSGTKSFTMTTGGVFATDATCTAAI